MAKVHGGTLIARVLQQEGVDTIFALTGGHIVPILGEYDTMVRLDLPVVGVMGNDGVWNNLKTFHRFSFPDRLVATDLGRRPYHQVVSGLGGYGEQVDDPADLAAAFKRAEASGRPALVDVHLAETMRMSSNYSQ